MRKPLRHFSGGYTVNAALSTLGGAGGGALQYPDLECGYRIGIPTVLNCSDAGSHLMALDQPEDTIHIQIVITWNIQ
jgi:hypothetical protein